MTRHSILISRNATQKNWTYEPEWYSEAFRNLGHKVFNLDIFFRSQHVYAPYPSASRVLRHRLKKMVRKHDISVVFLIHGGGYWTKEMLMDLKEEGIKVIYYNPDDPMLFDAVSKYLAPYCDVVFSFPKVRETYKKYLGINTQDFFYCVDPFVEQDEEPSFSQERAYASDILITGNIDCNRKKTRGDYLLALHRSGACKVAYYGPSRVNEIGELRELYKGEITDNKLQNTIIRSSKIIFHYTQEIPVEERKDTFLDDFQSVSGRLLDGAAAGRLVMTNYFVDLEKAFDIGKEIVVYNSIPDAIEKAKYYLHHDEERIKIAEFGREKALSCHTVRKRAETVIKAIDQLIGIQQSAVKVKGLIG